VSKTKKSTTIAARCQQIL